MNTMTPNSKLNTEKKYHSMTITEHVLKMLPDNAVNRGAYGEIKNTTFGDILRQRISSQCLKKGQFGEDRFSEWLDSIEGKGMRTRQIGDIVARNEDQFLEDHGFTGDAKEEAKTQIRIALAKIGKKDKKSGQTDENAGDPKSDKKTGKKPDEITKQIIDYGAEDIKAICAEVEKMISGCKKPADIANALNVKDLQTALAKTAADRPAAYRTAVTGRMATTAALRNIDAALMVSHAIGINRMYGEADFFTAVDEYDSGREDQGSAMMDYKEFNSSCMYIHEALCTDMAYNNLIKGRTDEEVRRMIEEGIPQMLHALAVSTPSGGQSNNACNSEPAAVLIEIRPRKNDFTYMNAFEEPVRADKNGTITRNGVQKLLNESIGFEKRQGSGSKYAIETSHWLWFTKEEGIRFPEGFGGGKAENFDNLGDLYDRLEEIIREES